TARSFIYTTAPPPGTAAASLAALERLQAEPERRARLWDNRNHFHAGLKALGFPLADSQSPIIPVLIGEPQQALTLAERLLKRGVYAPAIRPPTFPAGTSGIKTTHTSEDTRHQLDAVLAAFREAGQNWASYE